MLQDFYIKASPLKKLLMKAVIFYGGLLVTLYLIFRAYYINFRPELSLFSILLYLAEFHTIILMYGMLYSLWPRNYKSYDELNTNKDLQVNLFVTAAGEPTEVVRETVEHAKRAADYYEETMKPNKKPRVIVLNDAKARGRENWIELRDICEEMGVYHLARETNEGFKAGNINNGLAQFPADDPHNTIDCFFDSDFCAEKEFVIEILKPLTDESVDFVQSPQRYKNLYTWVSKAAGAHQIFFFDFICPAKAYDNALFLCGTNYAIRREAFLAAGGVDNHFVTEDYATSIHLHLKGKKGVFLPKVLAYGMAPMNLKEYFNQQTRWCKGCLDANGSYFKELFLGHLTARQKFHYFLSSAYYFIGIRDMILVLAPIPYLFFGTSLIRPNSIEYLTFIYLPLVAYNFIMFFLTFKHPVKSLVLDIVSFPVFATAFISSAVKKNLPFTITIKKYERENPFDVYKVQLFIALTLLSGIIYSLVTAQIANPYGHFINLFWASYSTLFLLLGFILVIKENYKFTFMVELSKRIPIREIYTGLKYATVVILAFVISISIPLIFNPHVYNTAKIIDNPLVSAAVSVVQKEESKELLVPTKGAYYGYYHPTLNSHPTNPVVGFQNSETPTLAMFYQDWNEQSLFDTRYMESLSNENVVPIVTWEPFDAQNENAGINKNGKPAEMILAGMYDEHIRNWAREAKKYNKPFFVRFAHEMNGNWYAWGNVNPQSKENYKKMWVHVHDIFIDEGATNVMWVWSPNNTDEKGETAGVLDYYPGSEYVDWVGYSAFNWGTSNTKTEWRNFEYISFDIYNELSTLNKPIMVSETSSVSAGGDKTGWFFQTLGTYIPKMDKIKAVVLFNQDFGAADFSLESGMLPIFVIEDTIISNSYYLKEPIYAER